MRPLLTSQQQELHRGEAAHLLLPNALHLVQVIGKQYSHRRLAVVASHVLWINISGKRNPCAVLTSSYRA